MELPQYSKFSSNEVKKALNVFAYSLTAYDINDTQGVYNYINQWTEQDIQYLIDSGDTYLPSVTPEDLENAQTQAPEIDQSDITSLNTTMYSTGDVNVRKGPSSDYEKVGQLTLNQEVKVTGQSKSTGWYRIEFNGTEAFVSSSLLSTTKLQTPPPAPSTGNGGGGNADSGSGHTDAGSVGAMDHLFGKDNPDWGESHITEGGWITSN